MELEDKLKLCKIVGILLLVDGKLHDEEVQFMGELMDKLDMSDDQRNEVMDRIDESNEVLGDTADLVEHAEALLEALQEASRVDGVISGSEADLIQMVTKVLEENGADITPP